MMFGWPSVRHMRRGLPKEELRRLFDFYQDYGRIIGFGFDTRLVIKEPGDEDPPHPADDIDMDPDRIQGDLL